MRLLFKNKLNYDKYFFLVKPIPITKKFIFQNEITKMSSA